MTHTAEMTAYTPDLAAYENPIARALWAYQSEVTSNKLQFDIDAACQLALTPDKPNTARSLTMVRHDAENIGNLCVILFSGLDGTGDESARQLADLRSEQYAERAAIVPRDKRGVSSEIHLSLLAHEPEEDDPVLFAGRLDMLGLRGSNIIKIASVGQTALEFRRTMDRDVTANPHTTLTTGYRPGNGILGERFGDPHAIVNPYRRTVQVCAFLALSEAVLYEHMQVPALLKARLPQQMPEYTAVAA